MVTTNWYSQYQGDILPLGWLIVLIKIHGDREFSPGDVYRWTVYFGIGQAQNCCPKIPERLSRYIRELESPGINFCFPLPLFRLLYYF